ncbi:hypothetical protein LOZ33_006747 [Ophidiomyces ophidiicola]|nr:hypothetical protein LOZ33_006747 [Ophidiomyces ophidiicola]
MEEYELVGAQEWLLNDNRPSLNSTTSCQYQKSLISGNPAFPQSGERTSLPRIQDSRGVQKSCTPSSSLDNSLATHDSVVHESSADIHVIKRKLPMHYKSSSPVPLAGTDPIPTNLKRSSSLKPGLHIIRTQGLGDNLARAAWRAGRPRIGQIRLPVPYAELKQKIINHSDINVAGETEHAFLEKIMLHSSTFIPLPNNNDQSLQVWGTSNQLQVARALVSSALSIHMPPETQMKRKSNHFAKITSYSEQKEERITKDAKHEAILQLLRQKPTATLKFPETLVFIWPIDELPMDACLGPQLEALDPLRSESGCPIYVDDQLPNYIRVDACDHDTILRIAHRLRVEWAKILAAMHVKVKLYLVQPPRALTKCEVRIDQAPAYNGAVLCNPILHGICSDSALFYNENQALRAKNMSLLRDSVTRSLQGLRFLRAHVRMRVSFGKFILNDYRVPQGGARYSFDKFRDMLLHSKTKGNVIPGLDSEPFGGSILTRIASATDILSPCGANSFSLENTQPLYTVNFEFMGEHSSSLQLETEFAKSPGSGLFEVSQRRWIRPQNAVDVGDKHPPLQVAVIDFERYSTMRHCLEFSHSQYSSCHWQLEICALNFQPSSSIAQSLRAFANSIHFKPDANLGFCGNITRRVTFSHLAPINRLVEKTALRYQLKESSYILEVARYDTYIRAISGTKLSDTPMTTWGASVFDVQWDNLLGQHANIKLGYAPEWTPSLSTWFPDLHHARSTDECKGFEQFIDLIHRIALLLSPNAIRGSVVHEDITIGSQSSERPAPKCDTAIRSSTR